MASSKSAVVLIKELPSDSREMLHIMEAVKLHGAQREIAYAFGVALIKLADMPDVAQEELPSDSREMLQIMEAVKLHEAQREIAYNFGVALFKLADMQDVAQEVRKTADEARTQHLMSTDLMKKFTETAGKIVWALIPMILNADELEDPAVVTDVFDKIKKMEHNMKKEAEDAHIRYLGIQKKVQLNLAEMTKKMKEKQEPRQTEGIRKASENLGEVDKQFIGIINFWSSMAAVLMHGRDFTSSGEVYLKEIENTEYTKRFKKSVARSVQLWSMFRRNCSDYIAESGEDTLYGFLIDPINETAADRRQRMKRLMREIENDINSAIF